MLEITGRRLFARIVSFVGSDSGQGLVEYGLILGLIAMVAIGAMLTLGGGVTTSVSTAANNVSNDTTTLGPNGH